MARRDFYDVLGVGRTASADEIQRAYRKLARTYHPDVNKDPDAEGRFKDISEAYDVLSDPETRKRYDQFGEDFRRVPDGVDPNMWSAAQQQQRGPRQRGAPRDGGWKTVEGFGGGDVDFEDLFGDLFGQRRPRGPARGSDAEAEIQLTVEDAYNGGRRRVTLSGPNGGREYEVNIPPGVIGGQRIRLGGQGEPGRGGAAGDLYLRAGILPHPRFRLEGRDIHVDLPAAPWEGALGARVSVETPGGDVEVTVPVGSSSGRKLRLSGRGMPNPKGKVGDLFAHVKIMVPRHPTERERELFEELASVSTFNPRSSQRGNNKAGAR
jgi:curved DNA-binding protein